MKVLVCISNVPDTETKIRITPDGSSVNISAIKWVINPWDELALTRAVELKKEHPHLIESITVVTVGKTETVYNLRKALAMGADKAIQIDAVPHDAWFVARQISEIIKRDSFDIVLTGIESSDFNGNAVGYMIAGLTEYVCISNVSSIVIEDNLFVIERETEGGKEKLEAEVPFIAVIQNGVASAPGIPSLPGVLRARNKPVEVIQPVKEDQLIEYNNYELPVLKRECILIASTDIYDWVKKLYYEADLKF